MIIDQKVWDIITNQTIVENKRSAVTSGVMLWPNGIVPYTIDRQLGMRANCTLTSVIEQQIYSYTLDFKYLDFISYFGLF